MKYWHSVPLPFITRSTDSHQASSLAVWARSTQNALSLGGESCSIVEGSFGTLYRRCSSHGAVVTHRADVGIRTWSQSSMWKGESCFVFWSGQTIATCCLLITGYWVIFYQSAEYVDLLLYKMNCYTYSMNLTGETTIDHILN